MANAVHHSVLGKLWVASEDLFNTPGSFVQAYPVADTVELTTEQAPLDRKTLSIRPYNYKSPVYGLKSASMKGSFYLQVPSAGLGDGVAAPAAADVPTFTLLSALFGGMVAASGSAVVTGTSASELDVTGTEGVNFPTGTWFAIEDPNGTSGWVPCRVTERDTDTLTFWPSLSAAPNTSDVLVNSHTFYPTRQNTTGLAVRVASGQDTDQQFQLTGGTGSLELSFGRGELAMMSVDLSFASYTGPSALGYSTGDGNDPMAAPMSTRNIQALFQTPGTTTRTPVDLDAVSVKLNMGMKHIETLGGTEGRRGVLRHEGVLDSFAEVELTFPSTVGYESTWEDGTTMSLVLILSLDVSGGGRRFILVDVPAGVIVGKPRHVKGSNGLAATVLTVRAQLDSNYSGSPGVPQLAEAPFRLSFIGAV